MQKSEVVCRGTTLRRNQELTVGLFSLSCCCSLSVSPGEVQCGRQSEGIMPWGWCRQVLLGVELGILASFLVAGCAIQSIYAQERAVGSSCYGGFDLFFVLDK